MLKKMGLIGLSTLLCGCNIMPGMKNLDTSGMHREPSCQRVEMHPTLIPITSTLIADQHVCTYHYRIAPADVLNILVWQHPEFDFLNAPTASMALSAGIQGAAGQPGYLVNTDGNIYFPLIGYIHVAGNTIEATRTEITERLKKYIPNPQVNVRIADYRGQKVYTLGEIKNPGILPINDQLLSIADALALAGGINPDSANPKYIYVIRGNFTEPKIFWLDAKTPDRMLLAEQFSLQPKDILFVSSAPATRWNRVLNQLVPTIQTIWYTQAIVNNS
ncbi:MAG: polysaccharide biosynthesis/export family protein [Gammaproteobacteria bacterium]|nr:polysaccharide biosynthesis/export family protein [Gammaproteobacteria bacterium]